MKNRITDTLLRSPGDECSNLNPFPSRITIGTGVRLGRGAAFLILNQTVYKPDGGGVKN